MSAGSPQHEVVVVGAGFSGIGAAIKLDRAGFGDLAVLEAGDGVGGAWHWNTYPGVAVDIPSFSYQFSFETSADWSRVYAPGDELKAYAEHCVDKYGIRDRIRLNTEIVAAEFDDDAHVWRLTTGAGDEIRRARWWAPPESSHTPSRRTSPASTTSPACSCTPRAGITTRSSAASAS